MFFDYVKFDKNVSFSTEISIDFITQINKPHCLGIKVEEKELENKKKMNMTRKF